MADVDFEKEMEEYANQAAEPEPEVDTAPKSVKEYELEMFLSTDGKHTVHIKVSDPAARHEAVQKAMEMYDFVLARYGTKQAQAVKEYANGHTAEPAKPDQAACLHQHFKFMQVKKEGPNTGKWFKTCVDCGKFMSWQ